MKLIPETRRVEILSQLGLQDGAGASEALQMIEQALVILSDASDFHHGRTLDIRASDLRELSKVRRTVQKAISSLNDFPPALLPAIDEMTYVDRERLGRIVAILELLDAELSKLGPVDKAHRGRPANDSLHESVAALVDIYRRYSGREPKAASITITKCGARNAGPFYRFCNTVVSIVDPGLERSLVHAIDFVLANPAKFHCDVQIFPPCKSSS